MAYETIKREKNLHPDIIPLMILLTDGAGNVSMSSSSPQEEGFRIAELIKDDQIKTVTINMEHVAFDQGLATKLAERMGGPCYNLSQLRADILYQTVKQEMDAAK
jgi:magnesium chelatase subunit D